MSVRTLADGKLSVVAACPFCQWRASVVAESPKEASDVLAQAVSEHVEDNHYDRTRRLPRAMPKGSKVH